MRSHLQFLSLNINGMRDNERWRGIFYWLKQLTYDVILLQDVRYHDEDNFLWSQEWGMPVMWSKHNAILLMNQDLRISKVDLDSPIDRFLVGKIHSASY